MGKIVKYCSNCDEGFAEKFGYCPNCAAPLQAFEMNPLEQKLRAEEEAAAEARQAAPVDVEPLDLSDETPVYDDGFVENEDPVYAANADIPDEIVTDEAEPVHEAPVAAAAAASIPEYSDATPASDETPAFHNYEPGYSRADDGGYYVTVIQEKNVRQRNLLLLGSTVLMFTLAVGGVIVSLFQKDLAVGAIGNEDSLASIIDSVPAVVEDKPKEEKKDKGGGGGGGGKEEKDPVNQGDLADQTKNPIRPPDVRTYRSDNFELKTPTPSTEGNQKFKKEFNQYGDPNSRFAGLSNGSGTGGGIGTGNGTGQGSGNGSGAGSGSGSGYGDGIGSGNGGGRGGGTGDGTPPPPKPVGVTTPMKILAKPRATYTDEARTANVQGSVTVKVTLLASGAIGNVSVVRGLPHGLSERAIAAARQIKFEPKKVNGVPQSTIVTFEYAFNIY